MMNLIARGDFLALMSPGGSGKRTLHENVRFPAHAFHGRETAREGMDLLHELHDFEGTAFLISTHDPQIAARCDRIVKIVDGKIQG